MNNKDIKYLFRNYRRYKSTIKDLHDKVEIYKAQAEKITPSYGNSGGGAGGSSSKVETNVIKYESLLNTIKKLELLIDQADFYLSKMKSYQRYIVKECLINHISYDDMARKENTSSGNIKKIIDNAINKLVD